MSEAGQEQGPSQQDKPPDGRDKGSGPYAEILYEVKGGIATITLNRPERRNPIGPTTVGELMHALLQAQIGAAVRVVVLTGAGKVFSAGGDLNQMNGSGGG